jgi:hypothetical protein
MLDVEWPNLILRDPIKNLASIEHRFQMPARRYPALNAQCSTFSSRVYASTAR